MSLVDNMNIQTLSLKMNERRVAGENIFLQQYLDTYFPEFGTQDERLPKYYHEMGIDYHNMKVSQLVDLAQRDPQYSYLFTETLLPALFAALYDDTDYRGLLAYSQIDDSAVVSQPYIKSYFRNTRKKEKALATGETPETHRLELSSKFTSPDSFGDIIEIPYTHIADCRLPVLNYFLGLYVLSTNTSKLSRVVKTIISGDEATDPKTKNKVDNSANVIGIRTANDLTFRDLKTPCLRMARLKFNADVIVGQEQMIDDISEMDEFKKPYDGKPIYSFTISGKPFIPTGGIMCDDIGENQLLLVCSRAACAEYVNQGLMLEKDKVISKQVVIFAFFERLHYQNLMRPAKLVIDTTLPYAENGFADYMQFTKPE